MAVEASRQIPTILNDSDAAGRRKRPHRRSLESHSVLDGLYEILLGTQAAGRAAPDRDARRPRRNCAGGDAPPDSGCGSLRGPRTGRRIRRARLASSRGSATGLIPVPRCSTSNTPGESCRSSARNREMPTNCRRNEYGCTPYARAIRTIHDESSSSGSGYGWMGQIIPLVKGNSGTQRTQTPLF
jgi:hypothetical protein